MTDQADEVRARVRDRYAAAATAVVTGSAASCCGVSPDGAVQDVEVGDGFGAGLYGGDDRAALPAEAVAASLGCGNPLAVADLHEGETVLDLGSGGGIDVLLSARRVGPTGQAYGLDMTDEMLDLARAQRRARPARPMSSSSRAPSRRSRCRTPRSMWSSPTA